MNSLESIIDMICTEAIEYGGIQEVPDRSDGTQQYFHAKKRGARKSIENGEGEVEEDLPPIEYKLELIKNSDGTYTWKE